MASIAGKTHLFFTTSPRTPNKMKDEVRLLIEQFNGQIWEGNEQVQANYFRKLLQADFYEDGRQDDGNTADKDLALAARDRITRAPKALGLVSLSPITLTEAGDAYLNGLYPQETFTRQLLKFQFPSPHHTDKSGVYWIRPYLELLRLINELDGLSKAEIAAFVTQLVHINLYETIKQKIVNFRQNYSKNKGKTNYKKLFDEIFTAQIEEIYQSQIAKKQYKTRESDELSRKKFIETKKGNHLDYADAAIRYLRETHLVSLKYNRIYVPPEKAAEVNFILENISREPFYVTDKKQYLAYQADSQQPPLLSDNHSALLSALEPLVDSGEFPHLAQQSIPQLKTIYHQLIQTRQKLLLEKQIQQLQNYQEFEDIVGIYQAIKNKELADAPVWMEWNTWRALTMLDDGEIVGNFSVDDIGVPLFTALGNIADIICFYTDYDLTVEVTLSSGATQFKMETDSVPRHFAKHKEKYGKPTYTLFIAQSLHHDTITYFFSLHKIFLKGFGGYAQIIPLTLQDFQTILEQAYTAQEKPTSDAIHRFLKTACDLAKQAEDEEIWYKSVQNLTHTWLTM